MCKFTDNSGYILYRYNIYLYIATRLERLDHLAMKFKHKCDIHEEWSYGKEDMLQAQDFKKCRLNELKVRNYIFKTLHVEILSPLVFLFITYNFYHCIVPLLSHNLSIAQYI